MFSWFFLVLQVFDEGRLSDSRGRVVDFRNTVVILTSNLGVDVIYDTPTKMESESPMTTRLRRQEKAKALVAARFAPEFANRIDEIIVFDRLGADAIDRVTEIQLKKLTALLAEHGVGIQVSDNARAWLAAQGVSDEFGARPLKRLIQNSILDPIATLLLQKRLSDGSSVLVSKVGEKGPVGAVRLEVVSNGAVGEENFDSDSRSRRPESELIFWSVE